MTQPLTTPRPPRATPLLVFSGSSGAVYRYARAHRYEHREYRQIQHTGQLDGLHPADFYVVRIADWNLNHDVAKAWGHFLERCRKFGIEPREVAPDNPTAKP